MTPLLHVKNLKVYCNTHNTFILEDLDLTIEKGQIMGLIGQSGSGKTMCAKSILQLHAPLNNFTITGQILWGENNILTFNEKQMCTIRAKEIGYICQNPMNSFNPTRTIASQMIEAYQTHKNIKKLEAQKCAIDLFIDVGITDATSSIHLYPHEFSGGMLQRAAIAMALTHNPKLILADEITTSLDICIKLQILDLLKKLQKKYSLAILFITHDLSLARYFCDTISVMHQKTMVESNSTNALFENPQHKHTKELIDSILTFNDRD